jgi:hypothetical protein
MAAGNWVQTFTGVIHQSAAIAGLIFLVAALRRFAMTRYAPNVPLYDPEKTNCRVAGA